MTPRVLLLFVGLAILLVTDVIAIAWLDSHELEAIGLATGLALLIWVGVLATDPRLDHCEDQ